MRRPSLWPRSRPRLCRARNPGFSIGTVLGGGGFARVFAARRDSDGQELALKVSNRRGDERLVREAETLKRLDPTIAPRFLGQGTTPKDRNTWPWSTSPDSSSPIGSHATTTSRSHRRALGDPAAARRDDRPDARRGVLHRDLKPENVFLRPDHSVTLIDFGLMRAIGDTSEAPTVPT